ncbi:MAG: sulfurtransferase [endosymbiont of Galathealinum brachiosum]|uniref:Sulfurtransferase n=1 Tax=endosymbiont of Galathealinum brachiosum TaxID=2200906 RepID=A0A370D845_9GAMM|nr:MAG: sulfurtransferase [endosymbiont of Galathealinum brachiosum]
MKTFRSLIDDVLPNINEIFPWDLEEKLNESEEILLIDITEATEYATVHIHNSINLPRGVLESGCDWGYTDTLPELASARDKEVIVICRSGNRSALAAFTMQLLGFTNVSSLKTGLRGWFDYELPLYDNNNNEVDEDDADAYFSQTPSAEQMGPGE